MRIIAPSLFLILSILPLVAQDSKRVALVIGTDAYHHFGALSNAGNDARSLQAILESQDFLVIRGENLDRLGIIQALDDFSIAAASAECALFFYAGHGVQSNGQNFLLPVDMPVVPESDLWQKAIPLDRIVSTVTAHRPHVSIIILDACRNNPLRDPAQPYQYQHSGLARAEAPLGTLIAYAADSGQEAIDSLGNDQNGLYTSVLVSKLRIEGYRIEDVFYETRSEVAALSNGLQTPVEYNKLVNTFYFDPVGTEDDLPSPVSLGAFAEETATPAPQSVLEHESITTLKRYYQNVNDRLFDDAYRDLSLGFRNRIGPEKFRQNFNSTLAIYPSRLEVRQSYGNRISVEVSLTVIDSDGKKSVWEGPVELVLESGEWKFNTGRDLKQVALPSPVSAPANPVVGPNGAPEAITRYFTAVNLRNFDEAYSLLSTGFRNRISREKYASIFDQTLSTYLVLNSPASPNIVEVTLSVIEKSGGRSTWTGPIQMTNEGGHWRIETMKGLKQR